MKKSFILFFALLYSTLVFSQNFPTVISQRAVATANLFLSDADKLNAEGIYEITENFVSIGTAQINRPFVGVSTRINETNQFGFSGILGFEKKTKEESILGQNTYTHNTPFRLTASFGFDNKTGIHYTFARDNNENKSVKIELNNGISKTTKTYTASWLHEFGYSHTFSNSSKLDIIINVILNNLRTTEKQTYPYSHNYYQGQGGGTYLGIKPSFTLPINNFLVNKITFNAKFQSQIYSNYGKLEGFGSGDKPAYKGWTNIIFFTSIKPTLEWNINNKVFFKSEPSFTFAMQFLKEPYSPTETNIYNVDITTLPILNIPIAMTYMPIDWIEIRAGLNYQMLALFEAYDGMTGSNARPRKINYSFENYYSASLGLGFVFEEDFLLDITFNANSSTTTDLLLNLVKLQFTYKW